MSLYYYYYLLFMKRCKERENERKKQKAKLLREKSAAQLWEIPHNNWQTRSIRVHFNCTEWYYSPFLHQCMHTHTHPHRKKHAKTLPILFDIHIWYIKVPQRLCFSIVTTLFHFYLSSFDSLPFFKSTYSVFDTFDFLFTLNCFR